MEEVAAVRGAALDAVGDVEPDRLRERIRERLEDGSMAPGVLTVLSAHAVESETADGPAVSDDAIAERGAGVQLIYEGLRLTRSLSRDPPWERDLPAADGVAESAADVPASEQRERTDGGDVRVSDGDGVAADTASIDDSDRADMDILVADVMVSRGFYLLARTEAAAEAVAVVRSFGGDQTRRRTTDEDAYDGNLEVDVFELAAVAGVTAGGRAATAALRAHVADLAGTEAHFPVADGLFSEGTAGTLAQHL